MQFHWFEMNCCPLCWDLQQHKLQETACVIVAAFLRESNQRLAHRLFLFHCYMLGTSDVGSESVSADVQLDAAKIRLLSPCGSDRLAVPVVIASFGAIIFQNPAVHEYTYCLSTPNLPQKRVSLQYASIPFRKRNICTHHGISLGLLHVYLRRMLVCSPQ